MEFNEWWMNSGLVRDCVKFKLTLKNLGALSIASIAVDEREKEKNKIRIS